MSTTQAGLFLLSKSRLLVMPHPLLIVLLNRVIPGGEIGASSRESGDATLEGHERVTPLPIQVIERNRLSKAELAALPRFKGHDPGEPSEVSIELKKILEVYLLSLLPAGLVSKELAQLCHCC